MNPEIQDQTTTNLSQNDVEKIAAVNEATRNMLSLTLQASLEEISEYNSKIASAKTQAKKDFYIRKIKKVTKRLSRILPS